MRLTDIEAREGGELYSRNNAGGVAVIGRPMEEISGVALAQTHIR